MKAGAKAHGAPIQCTKGKCSRAFHVSCASAMCGGVSWRVVEDVEKEVVLLPPVSSSSDMMADEGGSGKVIKTIKKLVVEVFCSMHNPVRSPAFFLPFTDDCGGIGQYRSEESE